MRSINRFAKAKSLVRGACLRTYIAQNLKERENNGSRWKLLLWRGQTGGHRFTGGDGLLSLQLLSLMVRRACQRFQPLEAGFRARHIGRRACGYIPEDPAQPAPRS